jgi:hypothetical protein
VHSTKSKKTLIKRIGNSENKKKKCEGILHHFARGKKILQKKRHKQIKRVVNGSGNKKTVYVKIGLPMLSLINKYAWKLLSSKQFYCELCDVISAGVGCDVIKIV